MAPLSLTQGRVDKLNIAVGRTFVADGGCRGLSVDVRPTGRTYRFRHLDREGRQRTVTIGNAKLLKLGEARHKARELARQLLLGEVIQRKKLEPQALAPQPITFGEFVETRYLPHARITKRGAHGEMGLLNNHHLPVFGARPLTAITKAEITAFLHAGIAKGLAPGTVNRHLNLMKSIFSRALDWEIDGIEKSPARGIRQLPILTQCERFLTPEEARRLLEAVAGSKNRMLAPIVAFLLLTGARKREALDARWENVDLGKGLWTVPLSKNGRPRHMPLSEGARKVLAQAKAILRREMGVDADTCPWVFANPTTGKAFHSVYASWDLARISVGLRDVRMHDLRHSFASALVNRGMTLYDVKELLGHASMVTTAKYAHLAPGRLMQAASEAAAHYQIQMEVPALPAPPGDPDEG